MDKKPSASATPDLDALRDALDTATFGSRVLKQALAPSLAMEAGLRSMTTIDAVTRWSDTMASIEASPAMRAFEIGRFGNTESFNSISAAVNRMLEPHRCIGESFAAMTRPFANNGLAGQDTQLLGISAAVTHALDAIKPIGFTVPDWTSSFNARLELFEPSWSIASVDLAVFEFGRLARLSDAVHLPDPYRREITELVEEELHEDEEDGAGGNGFDVFADEAMPTVVRAAGFAIAIDPPVVPALEDGGAFDGSFDPDHRAILLDIELRLRSVVVEALGRYAGKDWTRKVAQPVLAKWRDKQERDRSRGFPVLGLIHYSDLGELADIINGRGNWDNAFAAIFDHQADVVASIRRLLPMRNAVAHSRPLNRLEGLWLMAEATRLYVQLGVPAVRVLR